MKVFILEDDENRISEFRKWFAIDELVVTDTATEAREVLSSEEFDLILLDHDLGGEQMVDPSETDNTGTVVASACQEWKSSKGTPIIVHSCNPSGAKRMAESLQDAAFSNVSRIPFPLLLRAVRKNGLSRP